ncbi:MAG: hypothetical protein HZC37_06990 [Burkholderiales bacterium]|nr:hypothetical protein [Burkholderiales bacterium]
MVALLLFVQWTTASYACPQLSGAASESMGGAGASTIASMPDCGGDMSAMDPEQPQLCKVHCEAGQQSVNSGAAVLGAPPAMAHGGAVVGVLDIAEAAGLAAAMPPSAWGAGPPAGVPPLYLTLQVLRN